MFRCLGGGFRQDSLEDEVAWLKRMLEKESMQRKVAQDQLHQEQAKCAILEQEIQQAAAAAHEMGESLRQFFSRNAGSDCSDQAFQWASASLSCMSEPGLTADTPHSTELQQHPKAPHTDMQPRHRHDTGTMHDQIRSAHSSAPAYPHCPTKSRLQLAYSHDQQQQQQQSGARVPLQQQQLGQRPRPVHSSCSTRESQLRCSSRQSSSISEFSPLLNRQPSLSHKSSAKMKRHVLQVADQLKDLAISWQQRLEDYQPLHGDPAAVASAGAAVTNAAIKQYQGDHSAAPRITAVAAAPQTAAAGGAGASTSRIGTRCASPTTASAAGYHQTGSSGLHSSWAQKQQQLQCKQLQECQTSTESLEQPAASGSSQSDPPYPTTSVEWGSSSGFTDNHSGSTPRAGLFDGNGDVSSSTGSFVRYRSSFQQYGVTDIAEGDEDCESSEDGQLPKLQQGEEQRPECSQRSEDDSQGDHLSETVGEEDESEGGSCMTDEEAESQMLQWHLQQMEQQQQQQAPQRRLLTQQAQQQHAPSKNGMWQQQHQEISSFSAWNQPSRDASMPRCAITRGAASRNGTPPSSRDVHTPGSARAASLTPAAGPSPLAAGATALRSKTQARTGLQQSSLQAQQNTSLQDSSSRQQQQQYKRQQHLSLRQRESGGADVIPQGLKSMAPLRRHQQYLGTTG